MLKPIRVSQYVSAMRGRGVDPYQLLADTGLDLQTIEDSDALIENSQCQTVVANLLRLTGDPSIGFEMGRHSRLSDCGLAALAMRSSRTLRDAIDFSLNYDALIGRFVHLSLREHADKRWTIVFSEADVSGAIYRFYVEETLVVGMKDGGVLAGQPLRFSEVRLSYAEPPHANIYRETFNCPVHFNAAQTSITVCSPQLDTPLPHTDEELNSILGGYCARVGRRAVGADTMAGRVRRILLQRQGKLPTPEQVAEQLGMSARSLRRSLSEEGTSYQSLADQFRLEAALDYLRAADLTPKEIGYLLGFRDTNAFRRAFKTWSGKTIQEYRTLLRRQGVAV